MKTRLMNFILFFSIVLFIYGLVNLYIYTRFSQAISEWTHFNPWPGLVFLFLVLAYPAGRFLERWYMSLFSDVLTWIGSFWLAAMLYFFISIVLIDVIRLILFFVPWFSLSSLSIFPALKVWTLGVVVLLSLILMVVGYYNGRYTQVTRLELTVAARGAEKGSIRIAMASDIHLGTIIGKRRLHRLVEEINGLQPDIILLAGDIVDEDLGPVIRQNLGEALHNLRAPLGCWGITGNHEYIGGAEAAVAYLEKHGIRMLRDTAVNIGGRFWLIGREDRDKARFSGQQRLSLEELLAATDTNLPRILLDHQPFHLEKSAAAGIDLQLSGHTHHGQLWPLSLLTGAIYELSRGYLRKGDTHFYVSSGFGSWGPPSRVGSRSEIVFIELLLI